MFEIDRGLSIPLRSHGGRSTNIAISITWYVQSSCSKHCAADREDQFHADLLLSFIVEKNDVLEGGSKTESAIVYVIV